MEKDIYQLEVERLQAIPDDRFEKEIYRAWAYGSEHSCLFDTIGENTNTDCGCLTQIRNRSGWFNDKHAMINGVIDKNLTAEIIADERIPKGPYSITKESLPVFAEWQRRIKALEKV